MAGPMWQLLFAVTSAVALVAWARLILVPRWPGRLIQIPPLPVTFMAGPFGLLLWLVVPRSASRRLSSSRLSCP